MPLHKARHGMLRKNVVLVLIVFLVLFIFLIKYKNNIYQTNLYLNEKIDLNDLLSVCILSARNGGAYVKSIKEQHKLHQKSKGKTKEGANDPMTDGDLYSNIAMIKTLRNFFPNIPIVSEEQYSAKDVKIDLKLPQIPKISKEFVSQSDIAIWIDPLDATQEYTEDLLQYVTTMVCVAVKGVPIMGIINKPFQTPDLEENTYWGWVNHTYSPNLDDLKSNNNHFTPSDIDTDKELHQRNEPSIKVLVSRSHPGNINSVAQQILTKELLNSNSKSKLVDLTNQAAAEETDDENSNIRIIPAGGAGYKVLELLNGHAQYYLHTTYIKKWDICAGNALLDTLGGTLTDINGQRIEYYGPTTNNYKKENSNNSNDEKNSPFEVLLKTGLIARGPIQHRF